MGLRMKGGGALFSACGDTDRSSLSFVFVCCMGCSTFCLPYNFSGIGVRLHLFRRSSPAGYKTLVSQQGL